MLGHTAVLLARAVFSPKSCGLFLMVRFHTLTDSSTCPAPPPPYRSMDRLDHAFRSVFIAIQTKPQVRTHPRYSLLTQNRHIQAHHTVVSRNLKTELVDAGADFGRRGVFSGRADVEADDTGEGWQRSVSGFVVSNLRACLT
ncbi:hypothetical protein BV25DRAFT_1827626 [Artomyces pyxidatus]|uniref:Uncharacterized protein n=1 Tax=Artomyces pyxidatus TaxID=48021 RepID=A0ACB8SX24_9AGAM|nr:hypothetical protein BV25DRAFT_1827626 [Artomyces pyxidatus]